MRPYKSNLLEMQLLNMPQEALEEKRPSSNRFRIKEQKLGPRVLLTLINDAKLCLF